MPLISSVTVASFAGVGAANPAGRTNPTTTSPRPTSDALLFISITSGADYTTWAIRGICGWRATTEATIQTGRMHLASTWEATPNQRSAFVGISVHKDPE
jgi:hypothetical protein